MFSGMEYTLLGTDEDICKVLPDYKNAWISIMGRVIRYNGQRIIICFYKGEWINICCVVRITLPRIVFRGGNEYLNVQHYIASKQL